MNMDYTGEPGEPIESAVDVEPVDTAHDIDTADDIDLVTAAELEAEAIDGENAPAEIDDGDGESLEHEVVTEASATTRERHPAGAAALAKRVAMDRPTRIGVASLVFVALMFMFVFPTRSYLAQQRQVRDARHSVQVLRAQNEKLAREAEQLQTPREIERLARSQFNMVVPGEQAYNVVPPDGSRATTTTEP